MLAIPLLRVERRTPCRSGAVDARGSANEWKENRTFKLQDLPAVVALLSTMAGRRTRFSVYGMMKLSGRREGKGETEDHGMLKNVGAAPHRQLQVTPS
jgi:hypothetical protein